VVAYLYDDHRTECERLDHLTKRPGLFVVENFRSWKAHGQGYIEWLIVNGKKEWAAEK
jgi:hypothetical protein